MSALPGNRTRVTRMGILYDTTTPAVLPVWPLQAPYFLHCEKMDLPTTNRLAFQVGGIAQWQSIRLQIERSPVQTWVPPGPSLSLTRSFFLFVESQNESWQHVFFSRGVQLSGRAFDCRSRGPWFNSEHPLVLNFQLMTFLLKNSFSTTDQFLNMARTFICSNQQGVQLSGRAFDCRSRGPQFKPGCPLD